MRPAGCADVRRKSHDEPCAVLADESVDAHDDEQDAVDCADYRIRVAGCDRVRSLFQLVPLLCRVADGLCDHGCANELSRSPRYLRHSRDVDRHVGRCINDWRDVGLLGVYRRDVDLCGDRRDVAAAGVDCQRVVDKGGEYAGASSAALVRRLVGKHGGQRCARRRL